MVQDNLVVETDSIFVADEYTAAFDIVDDLSDSGILSKAYTDLSTLREALSTHRRVVLFVGTSFDPEHDTIRLVEALRYEASTHGRKLVVILVTPDTDSQLVMAAARAGVFRTMKKATRHGLLKIIAQDAIAELDASMDDVAMPMDSITSQGSVSDSNGDVELLSSKDPVSENTPVTGEVDTPLDNVSARGLQSSSDEEVNDFVSTDGIADGHRYPMERMIVLNNIPDEPGIITFYDEDEHPLMIEWAGNLNQRLNYYVDLHPSFSEVAKRAKAFDVLSTMDKDQEAKIFDRLVNKFGKFPLLMTEAPAGSSHYGTSSDSINKNEVDAGRITTYTHTKDLKMLDGIKALIARNPEDPETQDWLAFSLYSNNLLDEAIEWYTKLITKGSRREEHFFYCGNAFFKKGDVAKAVKLWTVSAKIRPEGAIAKKSRLRIEKVGIGKLQTPAK
jgi:hypothetical protein